MLIELLRLLPQFIKWHHFGDEVIKESNETAFSEQVFLQQLYKEQWNFRVNKDILKKRCYIILIKVTSTNIIYQIIQIQDKRVQSN